MTFNRTSIAAGGTLAALGALAAVALTSTPSEAKPRDTSHACATDVAMFATASRIHAIISGATTTQPGG
jgi:hypothetical protein